MRKVHSFLIFIFLLNFQYSYGDELLQKFNQIFIENRELSYELSIKTYNDPSSTKNEKGIASYYLGKYFFEKDDEDNENNLSKAYDYFKISSEKYNFANAHEMLGIMYSNSIYVSQNYEKSNYYLEKAINEKNFASYGILSDNYYFQGDWDKAELYAKKCIDFYDNTKIYATKKNQISCTYDLAWFLSNHNMSDERNVEAINLYKSIEQVDVRAAINLAYFYSDPMDARQIEINLLSKFDYFKSNYDKGLLSAELADHYNHIVKPKSAIKYANDSINFFQLARENSKTKYLEDIIQVKKILIVSNIAIGNFDEASRLLSETNLNLNKFDDYKGELKEKFYKSDFYELRFYEAEIKFHKGDYKESYLIFKNLSDIFSKNPELDMGDYLFQVYAYLGSIYSHYFSNINKADEYFLLSNNTYQEVFQWAFDNNNDFPVFPYEVIDLKMRHLSKYYQNELPNFVKTYLSNVQSLDKKNFGLSADAFSRATIIYFSFKDEHLCIDNGEKAISYINKSERANFHVSIHQLYEVLGDCYLNNKNQTLALNSYFKSIEIYESYFTNLRFPSTDLKNKYKEVIHKIINIKIQNKDILPSEIFTLIQKSKISFSAEAIFRNFAKYNKKNDFYDLTLKKSDLNQSLEILNYNLNTLNQKNASLDLKNKILNEILDVEQSIGKIDKILFEKFKNQNQFYFERQVALKDIQNLLSNEEVVFDFSFGRENGFLTILSKNKFEIYNIHEDQISIKRKVKFFLGDIILLKDISISSEEIYRSLFSNINISDYENKNIYFIYDKLLSNLPFSAIKIDNKYLIEKSTIAHLPSFSSLFFLKNRKQKLYKEELIGFANPKLNSSNNYLINNELVSNILRSTNKEVVNNIKKLPELPNTETELLSISNLVKGKQKLFLGKDANEFNVRNTNLDSKFLIFASHALISGEIENLYESGIVLTPTSNLDDVSSENDGLLLEKEILSLNINSNLTLLSACNTAVSGNIGNNDSLSGLTKSFFYAGSNNVLSTLWSIETNSAEFFTKNFFKTITDLITYADSVRKTKINMIKHKQYNHPFYWAPFILAGLNI